MWSKYCTKPRCNACGHYIIAFGLGMTAACCFPFGLIMFISALIITALGIIVIKS